MENAGSEETPICIQMIDLTFSRAQRKRIHKTITSIIQIRLSSSYCVHYYSLTASQTGYSNLINHTPSKISQMLYNKSTKRLHTPRRNEGSLTK